MKYATRAEHLQRHGSLHLMVDSTVSTFAKEYQREQWLFALVFVSLYWNREFSDEWIPSQANRLSVEVGLFVSLRGTDSSTCAIGCKLKFSFFSLSLTSGFYAS